MKRIFRYRQVFIYSYLLLIIIAGYFITKLHVEYNIDRFFPSNNPHLEFLKQYEEKLETDENYFMIGIEHSSSVFDSLFLNKVENYRQAIDTHPLVRKTTGLTNLSEPLKNPVGFMDVPVLHYQNPERYPSDSVAIFEDPRWVNQLISKDGTALAMLVKTQRGLSQAQSREFVEYVWSLEQEYKFNRLTYAGRSVSQVVFVDQIKEEVLFYVLLSSLVLLVILYIVFRRLYGVLIPFFSVILSLILFFGVLGLLQVPLDIMSTLYPTLILIIGMSDVIHIMSKYIDEQDKGVDRFEAMRVTIREIGFATLLTSLTTSIGFLALLSSRIEPLSNFGLYAALGVFLAYLSVIFFTTMVLVNFNGSQLRKGEKYNNFWNRLTSKLYFWVTRNQKGIAIGAGAFILLCVWGLSRISTNVFMLSDVPEDSEIRKDFEFFENKFAGVRPFEVAILPQGDRNLFDKEVLQEADSFVNFLNQNGPLGQVTSSLTVVKSIHKSLNGGQDQYFSLPDDSASYADIRKTIERIGPSGNFENVISEDWKMGRIMGRMEDIGSENVKKWHDSILHWKAQNVDTSIVDFRITGQMFLVDKNNEYLLSNLAWGLGLAFLVVGILMGLLFQNLRMVLLAFIPNIIPLLVAGAVMGFLGITFKATTAIIFTIAFGIAVDDTIHFLTRFKLAMGEGNDILRATYRTFTESGKAIILTTVILFVGFSTLLFSGFTVTYYIGLLIGITLVSAVIADLLLIPILLYRFYKRPK